jgi:predicted NAD-dependent protein-ADP-ribosyltransferase YbiA (DUF1768 family)
VSEEEMEAIILQALGPEHAAELSAKVEAAMQEDWDVQQVGVRITENMSFYHDSLDQIWSFHLEHVYANCFYL